jgi:hypothetical protein
VTFRTFGGDLDNTLYEFDRFCQGEHPCFNGRNSMPSVKMDGAKGAKDFRLRAPHEQRALLYRLGEGLNETVLVQSATHTRVPTRDEINQIDPDEHTLTRDHLDIHQTVLEVLKKYAVMGIQEDFPAYRASGWSSRMGKLLTVDQADYQTQHIFFDDNADDGADCIVDVRDVVTGEKLPFEQVIDMYVVKVHPHRAILEPDYFVKLIETAVAKRDAEIRQAEQATGLEAPAGESEWEQLQRMPDQDYLMRTVLPVLYQGMRLVDMERPSAPLEYLALYLLKN